MVIVVMIVEVIKIVNGLTIAWVVGVRLPVRCGFVTQAALVVALIKRFVTQAALVIVSAR